MSCPHGFRSTPDTCSACLRPKVRRTPAGTSAHDIVGSPWAGAAAQHRATSAAGGRARARKMRAAAHRSPSSSAREQISAAMSATWESRTGISTEARREQIRALRAEGVSYRDIARRVPCGLTTVRRVLAEVA